MRKVMLGFVFGILVLSLVVAGNGNDGSGIQAKLQSKISVGDYNGENGQQIQIQEKANKQIQLRVRNVSAHTGLNITSEQIQNRTQLNVKLSNGGNAEIKVMPDTASETALERLRLRVCSEENNCTIELKEVGFGDGVKVAYEVQTRKQVKFWGLFRTHAQVRAQIDAESGEVIQVSKPWWAVLVDESDE